MNFLSMAKRLVPFLLFLVLCSQFGCTTNKYRQPISRFQAAAAVVSADARKTYTEINRQQRNALIRKHARQGKSILQGDLDKVQPIKKEDLQARLDALDRLNDYVDLLVAIANSDAPQNVARSAEELTGAVANLVNTVNGLGNPNNENFRNKVNGAFGVASVLVSEVLKAFVQQKIKKGLERAVLDGEKPINELIDAIADDMRAYQVLNLAVFESERTDFLTLYNCEIAKKEATRCPNDDGTPFNQQRLESYKTQFINSDDLLENLRAADPRDSLLAMKGAHSKIVMLAKTDTPATFADAVAAIEAFADAAKRFGEAVEKLKTA